MNFYIASTLCWDYHPKEVIRIAKKYHFYGVEIWAEHFYSHKADPIEIKEYAKKAGISLTVHASSWDLNICSLNQGIRRQSIEELKKSIDLTNRLKARHMTFHPGRFTVKSYLAKRHLQLLFKSTKELLSYAAENEVVLSMELMEEISKEMVTNPEQMNELLKEMGKDLQTTLDIAHVPLTESPVQYFHELKQINSIHLSDSSKEEYHVPLGEGAIDIQEILTLLKSRNLPVVLEGMDTTRNLHFLKRHLDFLQHNGWIERKEIV